LTVDGSRSGSRFVFWFQFAVRVLVPVLVLVCPVQNLEPERELEPELEPEPELPNLNPN
jgi:hypothetical protein